MDIYTSNGIFVGVALGFVLLMIFIMAPYVGKELYAGGKNNPLGAFFAVVIATIAGGIGVGSGFQSDEMNPQIVVAIAVIIICGTPAMSGFVERRRENKSTKRSIK